MTDINKYPIINYNYAKVSKQRLLKLSSIDEPVLSVSVNDNDSIEIIYLEYENKYVVLEAIPDCCNYVRFEEYKNDKFMNLIDEQIESISYIDSIELNFSNMQEYDDNMLYEIKCKSGKSINFLLRNSHNGYYNGSIDIYCINKSDLMQQLIN